MAAIALGLARAVDGVDDQDRAVGGGDQIGQQQDHDQPGRDLGEGGGQEDRQSREQLVGHLGIDDAAASRAAQFEIDRGSADKGHPHETDQRGHQHHAEDIFADRPPARNPRDEHADKGREGDPPGPVEDRPVELPLDEFGAEGRVLRKQRQRVGDERADIIENPQAQRLQAENQRPEDSEDQQEKRGQAEIEIGQPLDPLAHTRQRAERRGADQDHECQNHRREGRGAIGIEQPVTQPKARETGHELFDAEAHGDGHAEDRSHDRDDVDDMAERARHRLSEQRRQRRADSERKPPSIGDIADRQADQSIGAPCREAPVEEGIDIGRSHRFGGLRRDESSDDIRVVAEMRQRLAGRIGQHADADPRPEQHGKP